MLKNSFSKIVKSSIIFLISLPGYSAAQSENDQSRWNNTWISEIGLDQPDAFGLGLYVDRSLAFGENSKSILQYLRAGVGLAGRGFRKNAEYTQTQSNSIEGSAHIKSLVAINSMLASTTSYTIGRSELPKGSSQSHYVFDEIQFGLALVSLDQGILFEAGFGTRHNYINRTVQVGVESITKQYELYPWIKFGYIL